jgi:hypothetical protein
MAKFLSVPYPDDLSLAAGSFHTKKIAIYAVGGGLFPKHEGGGGVCGVQCAGRKISIFLAAWYLKIFEIPANLSYSPRI